MTNQVANFSNWGENPDGSIPSWALDAGYTPDQLIYRGQSQFIPQVESLRSTVAQYFAPQDINHVLWLIERESKGDPNAFNSTGGGNGAHGLLQFRTSSGIPQGGTAAEQIQNAAASVYGTGNYIQPSVPPPQLGGSQPAQQTQPGTVQESQQQRAQLLLGGTQTPVGGDYGITAANRGIDPTLERFLFLTDPSRTALGPKAQAFVDQFRIDQANTILGGSSPVAAPPPPPTQASAPVGLNLSNMTSFAGTPAGSQLLNNIVHQVSQVAPKAASTRNVSSSSNQAISSSIQPGSYGSYSGSSLTPEALNYLQSNPQAAAYLAPYLSTIP